MSDRQHFEDYPGLKAHMSRMAASGTGSMIEWTAFIVALNTALTEARAQGAAEERERLARSLEKKAIGPNGEYLHGEFPDGWRRAAQWLRSQKGEG